MFSAVIKHVNAKFGSRYFSGYRAAQHALLRQEYPRSFRSYYNVNPPGSGAGRGGGAGGSVRESGGGLGQYGAAHEEEYFFNKRREQLEKIKAKIKKEEKDSPSITRKEEK